MPKRLQSKSDNDDNKNVRFYSVYKVIATLMYMNQPLSEILQLDIVEAQTFIQAYNSIRTPQKKNKK